MKKEQEMTGILRKTAQRNKLRDKGENINAMIAFLDTEGIEARYCPRPDHTKSR